MLRHQRLPQSALSLCWRQIRNRRQNVSAYSTPATNAKALDGIRIGIKANIVARVEPPVPATAASKMLAGYNSSFDSTVARLLKEQSATIQIDQGMDEFGMGSHSQFSYPEGEGVESIYARNGVPLSPGGSSGGSAVAVATGEVEVAVGTDTGGSVRLPAAYMGIVGFKPSYGRISRWGVVQYANSLDTVGLLGKSARRVRDVWRVLDKEDGRDPTNLRGGSRARVAGRRTDDKGRESLRIGIPLEYNIAELSPIVRKTYLATLRALQRAGHSLHPVSLPSTRSALSAYYVLAPAEASSNLAKYDGIRYGYRTESSDASPNSDPPLPLYAQTRGEGFGEEVKRRILLGAYTLSSEAMDNYFIQAQRVRRLVQRDFEYVFAAPNPLLDSTFSGSEAESEKVNFLLTPTAPTLPPTIEELKQQSPLESYMNDVFTVPASLAGLPAISVPAPLPSDELAKMDKSDVKTAGMHLIGQFGQDEQVLDLAEMLQRLLTESQ